MTFQEKEKIRQKLRDWYGVDQVGPAGSQTYEPWKDIVRDYRERATPRYGPHGDYPGMTVDPDLFGYDDPMGLLSSKEDMDAVLRDPTKQDYVNELDRMDPKRLQGPVRPMEMRTDGVPVLSQEEIYAQQPPGGIGGTYGRPGSIYGNEDLNVSSLRFPAGDQAQMGRYLTKSDRQDPNFYAPMAFNKSPDPGLLAEFNEIQPLWNSIDSTPDKDFKKRAFQKQPGLLEEQNMEESGWMKDKRMKDSQQRNLGLAQMLLNFGQQQSQDDHEWQDW